VRNAEDGT
jgi:hypothetical protein